MYSYIDQLLSGIRAFNLKEPELDLTGSLFSTYIPFFVGTYPKSTQHVLVSTVQVLPSACTPS